jgi:hypothetical protein
MSNLMKKCLVFTSSFKLSSFLAYAQKCLVDNPNFKLFKLKFTPTKCLGGSIPAVVPSAAQNWLLPSRAGDKRAAMITAAADYVPVVGGDYLKDYTDLPWLSLQGNSSSHRQNTRHSSRNNRQQRSQLTSRRPEEVLNNNRKEVKRPHSYGEFQLQELQPQLREGDGFKSWFKRVIKDL